MNLTISNVTLVVNPTNVFLWNMESYEWLVGVLLSVMATFFGALGKIFVAISYEWRRQTPPKSGAKALWFMGNVCIVVLNAVFDVASFAFAAQSLLAPLAGLSIAWNVILTPLLLHQNNSSQVREVFLFPEKKSLMRFLFQTVMGAIATLMGTALCAVSGTHISTDHGPADLVRMLQTPVFTSYTVFCWTLLIFLWLRRRYGILPDPPPRLWYKRAWHAIPQYSLALQAAIIGSFSGMYCKAAIEIVTYRVHHPEETNLDLITAFFVSMAVFNAVMQLRTLNFALEKGDTQLVVPTYQSTLMIFGVLTGMAYFSEGTGWDERQISLFSFGVTLVTLGLAHMGHVQPTVKTKDVEITDLDTP